MTTKHAYEADAHEAQMSILRTLLMVKAASFSDLVRSTSLTADHANFHIKQLVAAQMVEHVMKSYGQYRLTRTGKEYANRMDTEHLVIEKQPKLVIDICVENNGLFLIQERRKQPYYGYWGFPTGKIRWGETIIEAATRELMEETGLTADLRAVGTQHKRDYDENGELLEDKFLLLVHGENPRGDMIIDTESHVNHWYTPLQYRRLSNVFGDIDETIRLARQDGAFISETEHTYQSDSY